ncbi:MAG: type II secretion system F family protein [Oligoflexia bacterium]|nr:type II secretion system F family protein [Oligoflexia bacterium]
MMWTFKIAAGLTAVLIGFVILYYEQCRAALRSFEALKKDLDRFDTEAHLPLENLSAALSGELGRLGLYAPEERKRFLLKQRLWPLAGFAAALGAELLLTNNSSAAQVIVVGGLGLAAGYLLARWERRRLERQYQRTLAFFLPVIMERLVMAVQSGHDVFSALKSVVELSDLNKAAVDPVTKLLQIVIMLTEGGQRLEQALEHVSMAVQSAPVKHAFIHLAMAHSEGGELVLPLSELSDATQLFYQETIEEEIAKLPAKATIPLLLTFAGLIIFFLTAPLIQVLGVLSGSALSGQLEPYANQY